MKLTKKIVQSKPGMTIAKLDALFGGQASAWIQGEPIPRKYKSRLEQMFVGFKMDVDDAPPAKVAPIGSPKKDKQPKKTTTKPRTSKRRK